mgnify:CR=1 FL=1
MDDLICVTGRVRYDEFSKRLGVTADEVWNLMELRRRVAQYLEVEVTKDNLPALEDLKAVSDDLRIYSACLSASRLPPTASRKERSTQP